MTEQDDRHPDLTPLVGEFAADPDRRTRRSLLAHLEVCAHCREELARRDPSALFGLLALDPVPEAILARFDAGLDARLDGAAPSAATRSAAAWTSIAAAVVLAAVLGTYVVSRGGGGPSVAVGSPSQREAPTASAVAGLDEMRPVEMISSPGSARVLDLTLGEVDLVLIFDEALRL